MIRAHHQLSHYVISLTILSLVRGVTSFQSTIPEKTYYYSQTRRANIIFNTKNGFADGCVDDTDPIEIDDTVRVRIWRALSSGKEMSLSQLSAAVQSLSSSTINQHDQPSLSQSDPSVM